MTKIEVTIPFSFEVEFSDFEIVWYDDDMIYLQFKTSEPVPTTERNEEVVVSHLASTFSHLFEIGDVTSPFNVCQVDILSELGLEEVRKIAQSEGMTLYDES